MIGTLLHTVWAIFTHRVILHRVCNFAHGECIILYRMGNFTGMRNFLHCAVWNFHTISTPNC